MKQWPALDFTKTIAMVALILSHAALYFMTTNNGATLDTASPLFDWVKHLYFLSWLIFFLPIAAGCTFYFAQKNTKWKSVVITSAIIYVLGNIINVLTWGSDFFWSWNILQLVALSYLFIFATTKLLTLYGTYVFGVLTLGLGFFPVVDDIAIPGFAIIFGSNNFMYYWPFVPWYFMIVLGVGIAHYFEYNKRWHVPIIIGVALVFLSLLLGNPLPQVNPENIWDLNLFQPPISLLLMTIGLFLVVLSIATRYLKRIKKFGFISAISKGSLLIYAVTLPLTFRIAAYVPKEHADVAFLLAGIVLLGISWLIGYASIRLFSDKSLIIRLTKAR